MKKLKKISALFLCFLMVAASCIAVSADDVVKGTQKGSISIYTYESKVDGKVASDTTLLPATGKVMTVPTGYTAIQGVTYQLCDASGNAITGKTATTDANGLAQFTDLAQATYVVKVASYPTNADGHSNISGTIADMKVTIPMTNTDGTGLFYDVNVYPKVDSVYGTVEFTKTNDDGVGLSGAEFKLEWKVDGNYVAYNSTTYTTDSNGKFTIGNLPKGEYRLIETKQPSGYLLDTTPQYFEIGKDASNTTYDDVSKTYKTSKTFKNSNNPTIQKTVGGGMSTNAGVGQDVTWTITPSIPTNLANYQEYTVIDTLDTALTYKSVAVKTGTAGATTLVKDTDYTVTVTGQEVKVAMTATGLGKIATTFSVEITTTVNADTDLYTGVANGASLSFKNQYDTTSTVVTTPDQPKVFTGGINFTKTGENSVALAGAQFKLYKTQTDAANGTNEITFYSKDLTASNTVATSAADGSFGFYGLAYGTYYMVEVKAPTGYELMGTVTTITIDANSYSAAATAVSNVKSVIELPFTGGVGPEIVVISGVLMMAAAAFVLKKSVR